MKQAPWGEQSRSRLQALLPVNAMVTYQVKDVDRYGRSVSEVFSGGANVNLALVQEGQAVAYREYLGKCDGDAYLKAEAAAKDRKLAFWNQARPVMPWDFRKGKGFPIAAKPAAKPAQKPAKPECDPNYRGACIPLFSKGDINCGDISARRFESIGTDPHRLDGDKDGLACERD
jgi:micrococcal nuclease